MQQVWEYWHEFLVPNVTHVPLEQNLSDLESKLTFYLNNPDLSFAIAEEGRKMAKKYLSTQGALCYWWRLLNRFALLQVDLHSRGKRTNLAGTGFERIHARLGRAMRNLRLRP